LQLPFCYLSRPQSPRRATCGLGEQSTGFKWDGQRWTSTKFTAENDKFVVQQVPERNLMGEIVNFEVTMFGETVPRHRCFRSSYDGKPSQIIICGGLGWGFQMNTKSLRYQEFYGIGYLDGEDKPGNTPSLTIGRCSRIK
jgi:hypothetical protein